jgi:RNA polymerase sigma-70 factor (ECF subfamily)
MNDPAQDAMLISLLDRVGQGDKDALKALYDITSSRLYGLAQKIVTHRDWAEDVLQESFLSIWRSAAHYQDKLSPPLAWMGLIVRSRALDHLRQHKRQGSTQWVDLDDPASESISDSGPAPHDQTEMSEQAWALHQCLDQLEGKQRQAVSLAFLQDLSHSELAQQLRKPLGTVKSWIRRGIDQLRTCMSAFS